jgi:hypothetical protein
VLELGDARFFIIGKCMRRASKKPCHVLNTAECDRGKAARLGMRDDGSRSLLLRKETQEFLISDIGRQSS